MGPMDRVKARVVNKGDVIRPAKGPSIGRMTKACFAAGRLQVRTAAGPGHSELPGSAFRAGPE